MGFFYLNSTGQLLYPTGSQHYKCSAGTTHSGAANGRKAWGCQMFDWNFFNETAKEYYLEVYLKRLFDFDPDNEAFDSIFFDAALGFMRGTGLLMRGVPGVRWDPSAPP